MSAKLTAVIPQQDFVLHLIYDNGERRKMDMNPYLDFGVFRELSDIRVFNSVHIAFDAVRWDNDIDLDPEFLYTKSVPVTGPH